VKRLAGWLLVAALLSGCAGTPIRRQISPEIQGAWDAHQASVMALNNWYLQGRVAVSTEDDGWTATLQWTQSNDAYVIRIIAPFGQGTYELQGQPGNVVMRAPKRVMIAKDPETLMQSNLGWTLPLAGLRFWVRGLPDPAKPATKIRVDDQGRLTELDQGGWHIDVLGYVRRGTIDLPEKLYISARQLEVRLAVKQWETTT
jgi:outer membrane lipoprotein LolB